MTDHQRAQRAVLDAVAQTPEVFRAYALKGGLALRLAYGLPRRSDDLDFDAIDAVPRRVTNATDERLHRLCDVLTASLDAAAPRHGFARLALQDHFYSKELPALLMTVGYTGHEEAVPPFAKAVELQVILSEVTCATRVTECDGLPLHVPVLEDILAGKLKALAQQARRDRPRGNDVFDLWYITTQSSEPVDPAKVTRYLLAKIEDWPELDPLTKSHFYTPDLAVYAASSYDDLAERLDDGVTLLPFEVAYQAVMDFVDRLDLPEKP